MAINLQEVTNSRPDITGDLWVAPYSASRAFATLKPSTLSAFLTSNGFKDMGAVRQDAPFTRTAPESDENNTTIKAWGGEQKIYGESTTTSISSTVTLMQYLNVDVQKFVRGENNVVVNGTGAAQTVEIRNTGVNTDQYSAIVSGEYEDGRKFIVILPKISVRLSGDIVDVDNEIKQFPLTLTQFRASDIDAFDKEIIEGAVPAVQSAPAPATSESSK